MQITLTPKGRATFIGMACIAEDCASYQRVEIPQTDIGRKLGYTEMLDVISYFHLAQSATQSECNQTVAKSLAQTTALIKASTETADSASIEQMSKPKQPRRKTTTRAKSKKIETANAE